MNKSYKTAEKKAGRLFADLYEFNAGYDAGKYAPQRPFIVLKATEGLHHNDSRHAERSHASHQHGLAVGHYHFLRPENGSPRSEAEHFWEVVKPHLLTRWPQGRGHDQKPDQHVDFLIVDVEVGSNASIALQRFDDWFRHISGRSLIGYSGLSFLLEHNLHLKGDKWWVADYPYFPRGLGKRILWAHQFTSAYHLPGIGQACDASVLVDRNSIRYWANQ